MNEMSKAVQLRAVKRNLLIFIFATFLIFSAYFPMVSLQSSVNIKDGLGSTSISTAYISAVIFCFVSTPLLIRRFGLKKCILASDIGYMTFILANFYPEYYTLVPASILAGFAEGTIWTAAACIIVRFATEYSNIRQHDTKKEEFHIGLFSGYFFAMFQSCQISGNLISYIALHAVKKENDQVGRNISKSLLNISVANYCGSNDCQDPEIIGHSLDQYVPTDPLTYYVLIGIFSVMCLTAVILHFVFLPDPETYSTDESGEDGCDQNQIKNDVQTTSRRRNQMSFMIETLKDEAKHLLLPTQLLIAPITVYSGLVLGFVFGELTRAFSSCVSGVSMVGIHMMVFGVCTCFTSYMVNKLKTKLGRSVIIVITALLDIGNYMYCIFWIPSVQTSWTVFIIFSTVGFSVGIWQPLLNVLHLEYFPREPDVAATSWNLFFMSGLLIQFSWSTALCVRTKLYIHLGMLVLGLVGYGLAERVNQPPEEIPPITNERNEDRI